MTPPNTVLDDFVPVSDPLDTPPALVGRYGTGLTALDTVPGGGIRPGDLWLIVSAPGQGRSMLLTQLAGHLALHHALPTHLVSNRDSADVVSARLHANATSIPLGHLLQHELYDSDTTRIPVVTPRLTEAPLRVAAGPYARHRTLSGVLGRVAQEPEAAAFDDPSWETEWDLREARQLADRGWIVMLTLPDEQLLEPAERGQLNPRSALADVVVHVQHDRITPAGAVEPDTEPGTATITVLRNRRGPRHAVPLRFLAHYARFADLDGS